MIAPAVKLEVFEGPLDLLLHLIKRNEVQVTDIPIAAITDEYLAALEAHGDLTNLDTAGEYLVMAATLVYIKSRMLLPASADDEPTDEDDPREALVQQLLEYQRFREAAAALANRELLARDVFAPPGEPLVAASADEARPAVRDATLADLLEAIRTVLQRHRPAPAHEIDRPMISVRESVRRILARFALSREVEFGDLFATEADRGEVIVTFLALLELVKLKVVRAQQAERFGPIALLLATASLEEATERLRDGGALDTWSGGGEESQDEHGIASLG